MKKYFTPVMVALILLMGFYGSLFGQRAGIGTGTPDVSALLDISHTSKGLLIPRMGSASIAAIPNPAKGLLVYDSIKNQLMVNTGNAVRPKWQSLVAGSGWTLNGNAGTDPVLNFIGTTDEQPLLFKINNEWSGMIDSATATTMLGWGTGKHTSGIFGNTAFGGFSLQTDIKGQGNNTALGVGILNQNTTGYSNTAIGFNTLANNVTGNGNTANGANALSHTARGSFNTAIGDGAVANALSPFNSTGPDYNTAIGYNALQNPGGNFNTANGMYAGSGAGNGNTVTGHGAMQTAGSATNYNTVEGTNAMQYLLDGDYNSVLGSNSLTTNNKKDYNIISQTTAVGFQTLSNTDGAPNAPAVDALGNTVFGYEAGSFSNNGAHNCFIGAASDISNGSVFNSIVLGHGATASASNMVRVGNPATTSIGGPVKWSVISDARVKKNVQGNIPGLSFIMKLRPVTYTINTVAIDAIQQAGITEKEKSASVALPPQMAAAYKAKEQIIYTGFVAQEVEQAAKSIHYDFDGVDAPKAANDLYALRYESFVMPLVKSVQELALQSDSLTKTAATIKGDYQKINERLDALEKKIK